MNVLGHAVLLPLTLLLLLLLLLALFCHANGFNGVHSVPCYWRTIWDKLTFMPTARLIWLFYTCLFLFFSADDKRQRRTQTYTVECNITKNIRLKNIPKDTQTQTFYIFMFYDSVLSVELLPNKWIFFFFFLSRFSCKYCIFRSNCLHGIDFKPSIMRFQIDVALLRKNRTLKTLLNSSSVTVEWWKESCSLFVSFYCSRRKRTRRKSTA